MHIHRLVHRALAATILAAGAIVPLALPTQAAERDDSGESIVASFEGGWIRLADGWGEAHACFSDDDGTRCYRTEDEMRRVEGLDLQHVVPMASCGGPLYLYDGINYGLDVLALSTRGVTINLSPYGFNNVTSSYKIGSCDARFYDTTSGGTSYPGSTSAWVWSPSMSTGWNNRVGSVYIT